MTRPALAELHRREVLALLDHHGIAYRIGDSGSVVGGTRDGHTFAVHVHEREVLFKAKVSKLLRQAGISQDEFWQWWTGGRR